MKNLLAACLLVLSFSGCNSTPVEQKETKSAPAPKPLTKAQKDSLALAAQTQPIAELTDRIERMKVEASNPAGIVEAFEANEVQATERFKGRRMLVTGTIESIGLDIMDHPYITLGPTSVFRKVQCLFENKSAVSSLHKGQEITLRGECKGLMMNVLLGDCTMEEGLSSMRARLKALPKDLIKPRKKQKPRDYFKS